MKRILVVALALAFIGGIAFGDPTNQVLSKNAVGYVKVTIPRGALMMMQTPFESLSGAIDYSTGELLGSNVPNGTSIYFWNQNSQEYVSERFISSRWQPGTNRFERGEGLFMAIPATAGSNSYDIFLMGEVPDTLNAPTSDTAFVQGLQMIGYMYPTAIALTNSALTNIAKRGDSIYFWKEDQTWGSERFISRWQPGTLVLQPGQAYYYSTTNATTWSESKPYTWP